jgi:hypothetical protein
MTDYSLDTSTLSQIYRSYYKNRFPSFWVRFNELVSSRRAVSVSEVEAELTRAVGIPSVVQELKQLNQGFFSLPSPEEQEFMARIFSVPHFQNLLSAKAITKGTPVADPFVIAKAGASIGMCVVTEEVRRPNATRIPNVCDYFDIECINLEQVMEREGWRF